MKNVFAFILLLVYFTVSTGFVVSVHYCINKVSSVKMGAVHGEGCDGCGVFADNKTGCCQDSVALVKLKADQVTSGTNRTDLSGFLWVSITTSFFSGSFYKFSSPGYPVYYDLPLKDVPIYLQNCVFRI